MSCTSEKWVPELFRAWESVGIRYAVLRNHERLPADTGNDLDLLVDPQCIEDAERILIQVMAQCGGRLHNRAEFSPVSIFFYDPQTLEQFHIDLFRDLKWRGFDLLKASDVLNRARRHNGMPVPSQADEAVLNLITRLVFGGYVRDKYRDPVRKIFTECPESVLPVLMEAAGPLAPVMLEKAQAGDWAGIEALTAPFRKIIIRRALKHPLNMLADQLYDLKRLLARWMHVPGLALVFTGPDGCGKTSVAAGLKEALAGTFYPGKGLHCHWKPLPAGAAAVAPTVDPHSRPPRSRWASFLFFAYHGSPFLWGWLRYVRPVLFGNGLAVIDRYYYDFFVDLRRYRLNIPQRLVRAGFFFVKKPDLVFCLDAEPEVLQARKKEVSFEECSRQREAYRGLIGGLPNGRVLDASRPLDQVVRSAQSAVLQAMAERMARRGFGKA